LEKQATIDLVERESPAKAIRVLDARLAEWPA
jgi:hypothetical protein